MIIALVALVLVVLFVLAVAYGEPQTQEKDPEPHYTQDIDFSLAVKGYPVVNDADIAYTEWLARNPDRSQL